MNLIAKIMQAIIEWFASTFGIQPLVPVTPGWYSDKTGDWWFLDDDGAWTLKLDVDAVSSGSMASRAPYMGIDAPTWWPDYPNAPASEETPPVEEPVPDPIETGNEPEDVADPMAPALPMDDKIATALEVARGYLGTAEDENGETEFGRIFNNPTGAWCSMFTSVVLKEAGLRPGIDFPWTAWTPAGVAWGKKNAGFFTGIDQAKPGDLIYFMWDNVSPEGRGVPPVAHVGIVEAPLNAQGYITTIEGNTSDMVARRLRSEGIQGFVRPLYGTEVPDLHLGDRVLYKGLVGPDVAQWQVFLNEVKAIFAKDLADLEPDGVYGENTKTRTNLFQVWAGLAPDGAAGPLTLDAMPEAREALTAAIAQAIADAEAAAEAARIAADAAAAKAAADAKAAAEAASNQWSLGQIDNFLKRIGLPYGTAAKREASTRQYQEASTWYKFHGQGLMPLAIDGDFGPATTADAKVSVANDYKISPHFRLSEWRTPTGAGQVMRAKRKLVIILEGIRADGYSTGLTITSGYRDPAFNKKIGGTWNSCHLDGSAADIPRRFPPSWFKNRGLMGIEYRTSHGLVTHVDVCTSCGPDCVFHE